MKRIIVGIVFISLSIINFTACNKTSQTQNVQKSNLNYKISEVVNKNLIKKFKSVSELQTLKSSSNISFDYSHIYKITVANHPLHSLLMIRQQGYDKSNSKNYGFFVVMRNNDTTLYNPFIAETEKLGKYKYQISYFNDSQKPVLSVIINSSKKTVQIVNQKSTLVTTDCGQDTADCISDAYTKHGWVSVAAWIETAFIPETAAAIAIDCAMHNCT